LNNGRNVLPHDLALRTDLALRRRFAFGTVLWVHKFFTFLSETEAPLSLNVLRSKSETSSNRHARFVVAEKILIVRGNLFCGFAAQQCGKALPNSRLRSMFEALPPCPAAEGIAQANDSFSVTYSVTVLAGGKAADSLYVRNTQSKSSPEQKHFTWATELLRFLIGPCLLSFEQGDPVSS
jgi:hypothetical protein